MRHQVRQFARIRAHPVDLIEPDDRRRGVDRVHDVVERPGERVDIFAVERRHERAMQALDDLVRDEVALVLDFLDLVGLVPDRPIGREHLFEEARALANLLGQGHEVVEEPLFSRNESERHVIAPASLASVAPSRRILADSHQI